MRSRTGPHRTAAQARSSVGERYIDTVEVGSSILPAPTRTMPVRDARTGGPPQAGLNHPWSLDDQWVTTGAGVASLRHSATEMSLAARRSSKSWVYRSNVSLRADARDARREALGPCPVGCAVCCGGGAARGDQRGTPACLAEDRHSPRHDRSRGIWRSSWRRSNRRLARGCAAPLGEALRATEAHLRTTTIPPR